MFVDGKIHIIGSEVMDKHFIFNKEKSIFDEIHNFNDKQQILAGELLFCEARKSILTTTYNRNNKTCPVSVWQFRNSKWSDLNIKDCEYLYDSDMIETADGDYLIFVSGFDLKQNHVLSLIYVCNVKNSKLIKSSIKTPEATASSLMATMMRCETLSV